MSRTRSAGGFSLVELMVTLTIAAVLLASTAPSLGAFIRNNRLQAKTLAVLDDINFARSEAVKRKVRVVMCRSANPGAAVPSCGGTNNVWTTGWLIFASGDTNNTYESATDSLLRIARAEEVEDLTVITNSTSNNNLEYNPDGTTNEGGGTARFAVCDDRGGALGRQINVPPHGRLRLVKGDQPTPVNCSSPS